MSTPLMPKAVAVWLIDNTALTFDQISAFCGLHALEVQAIADGEVAVGIVGKDPIATGELTREEIERCEADSSTRLKMAKSDLPKPRERAKGPRYTPVSKRGDKPDAIAWILKTYPAVPDSQIAKLIGTTKPTINSVRERTHPNTPNMKPRSPVLLGLCTQVDLDAMIDKLVKQGKMKAPTVEDITPAETEEDKGKQLPGGFDESAFTAALMADTTPKSAEKAEPDIKPEDVFKTAPAETEAAGTADEADAEADAEAAAETPEADDSEDADKASDGTNG